MTLSQMTEDQFWDLIDSARHDSPGHIAAFVPVITRELGALSPAQIAAFGLHLQHRLAESYTWGLWGAAFVIGGGCSDDSFDSFHAWLIAQGRDTFKRALAQPDDLADLTLDFHNGEADLELFLYVPSEVYEACTGREMPRPPPEERPAPTRGPSGMPWEENDLDDLFPKLTAQFD